MLFLCGGALLLWESAQRLQDGIWPNLRFGDFWILYLHLPIPISDGSALDNIIDWFMRQRPSLFLTVLGIILAGWANHRANVVSRKEQAQKARKRLEPA